MNTTQSLSRPSTATGGGFVKTRQLVRVPNPGPFFIF